MRKEGDFFGVEGDERLRPPLLTPPHLDELTLLKPRYDSKFYEWQALCYVASVFSCPVATNVREIHYPTPALQSREFDGIIEHDGLRILVEVKSFSLGAQDVSAIESKFQSLGFDRLIIVAPSFSAGVNANSAELIEFEPQFDALEAGYSINDFELPNPLEEELETGDHHFRFLLAKRGRGETSRFRNQIDKRIKTYPQLLREIKREGAGDLPIRVFWSASRWAYPKELYYSSYFNHLLRRGLVFDIDGKAIHNKFSACQIAPGRTTCQSCIDSAKQSTAELIRLLASQGISTVQVVFSGRQGFHTYVLERYLTGSDVRDLTDLALKSGIPVDENVALGTKTVVTMPGSIHGLSMLRAIPIPVDGIAKAEQFIYTKVPTLKSQVSSV